MDNRDLELFQAIQGIIDPLREDVQSMKNDMQIMKDDINGLKGDVQGLKSDMKEVKERLTNVENEVHKTNVIIETEIRRDIRLLAEGHKGLVERLGHLPADVEIIKEEVSTLKFIQTDIAKRVYRKQQRRKENAE